MRYSFTLLTLGLAFSPAVIAAPSSLDPMGKNKVVLPPPHLNHPSTPIGLRYQPPYKDPPAPKKLQNPPRQSKPKSNKGLGTCFRLCHEDNSVPHNPHTTPMLPGIARKKHEAMMEKNGRATNS